MKDVNATDRANYTLYSLRENKVIATTEQDTDKWDIGFSGTKIIINGGKIRKGKGAATIIKGSSFDGVKLHLKIRYLKRITDQLMLILH